MKDTQTKDLCDEFTAFFQNCDSEQVLDAVQVVMSLIEDADRSHLLDHECNAHSVAAEINRRFLEHRLGYKYQSGQIVMETNSILHAEAIALALENSGAIFGFDVAAEDASFLLRSQIEGLP